MDEVEEPGDLLKVDVAIRRAIHVEGELQTRPFEASFHEPLRIASVCLFRPSLGAPARVAQEHLQQHDGAEVGRAVSYRFWPIGGDRSPLPSMWPPARLLVVPVVLLDEERVVLPVGGRYPQL